MAASSSPFKQARRVEAATKGAHSPVGVLLGVGKKTGSILNAHRIITIAQAAAMNDSCFASLVAHGAMKPREVAKIREAAVAAVSILTDKPAAAPEVNSALSSSLEGLSLDAGASSMRGGPGAGAPHAAAAPACSLTGLNQATRPSTPPRSAAAGFNRSAPSPHRGRPEGSTGAGAGVGPGTGVVSGVGAGAGAGAGAGGGVAADESDDEEGKGRVAGDDACDVTAAGASGSSTTRETAIEGALPACPYDDHPNVRWRCAECGDSHTITSRRAESPFFKKCGWRWMGKADGIALDGDCFYNSVRCAVWGSRKHPAPNETVLSVKQLRNLVATEMGQEQLDFYRMMAAADPDAQWLDFVRPGAGVVTDVASLREYARNCGADVGSDFCLWGDTFAQAVLGRALSLHILFVDMDRAKSSWPYRWLTPRPRRGDVGSGAAASAASGSSPARPQATDRRRFIVLKRERRQHFVALASVHGASCFARSELPDVIRVLWDVPDVL